MADEEDSAEIEEEQSIIPCNKNELTAKQRKNKRKKEAAKKKKQELKEKDASKSSNNITSLEPMPPQGKLEEELAWCITQLEIGLKVQKPDKRTASHTEQLLNNLKSPKVSLPKKRQIMHSVFGDYRKKMQDDVKKAEPEKLSKVFPVKKHQQKSVFLRVAQDKHAEMLSNDTEQTSCSDSLKTSDNSISTGWKFKSSCEDFKFNFDSQES